MTRLFTLFLSLFSCLAFSQNHQLTVDFQDLPSDEGFLMIRILDKEEEVVKKDKVDVTGNSLSYTISLPAGEYAVQAYHDENSNGEIDKNMMGIPTEEYGFSNNVRGIMGPPDIEDQLVVLKADKKISIDLD